MDRIGGGEWGGVKMTLWLELKDDFWLEYLGGQGCCSLSQGRGVMGRVQTPRWPPHSLSK